MHPFPRSADYAGPLNKLPASVAHTCGLGPSVNCWHDTKKRPTFHRAEAENGSSGSGVCLLNTIRIAQSSSPNLFVSIRSSLIINIHRRCSSIIQTKTGRLECGIVGPFVTQPASAQIARRLCSLRFCLIPAPFHSHRLSFQPPTFLTTVESPSWVTERALQYEGTEEFGFASSIAQIPPAHRHKRPNA